MEYYGVLHGETMRLPFYGKYCGIYGYFTRDGFIYAFENNADNTTELGVMPVVYSRIIEEATI